MGNHPAPRNLDVEQPGPVLELVMEPVPIERSIELGHPQAFCLGFGGLYLMVPQSWRRQYSMTLLTILFMNLICTASATPGLRH